MSSHRRDKGEKLKHNRFCLNISGFLGGFGVVCLFWVVSLFGLVCLLGFGFCFCLFVCFGGFVSVFCCCFGRVFCLDIQDIQKLFGHNAGQLILWDSA